MSHKPDMANTPRTVSIVSAVIGEGAGDGGCKYGASALLSSGLARSLMAAGRSVEVGPVVIADAMGAHDRMDLVGRFSSDLTQAVRGVMRRAQQPLVLGGDHSCAIGTWSGVALALAPQGRLGLIWVDAHLDAHTPQTSESDAPHGMPLAALLGHGSPGFTGIGGSAGKLRPCDAVVIGARSYEDAERRLLERLGVRVMYMEEVRARGFGPCFAEARALVSARTAGWGVSFDVDALDPADAPATGTPVAAGISLAQATVAMELCRADPRFLALEIAEYNPLRDYGGQTARAIHALAAACVGCDSRDPSASERGTQPSSQPANALSGGDDAFQSGNRR